MRARIKAFIIALASAALTIGAGWQAVASVFPNDPLVNHGGYAESSTRIYIVFWGDWSFTVDGYQPPNTGAQMQTLKTNFAKAWGGSTHNATTTQYGTTNASTAANTTIWNDTSALPCNPPVSPPDCNLTTTQIKNEAIAAAEHFGGCVLRCYYYPTVSALMVLTPPHVHWSDCVGCNGFHDWVPGPIMVNSDAGLTGLAYGWTNYEGPTQDILSHELGEIETDPTPNVQSHEGWYDVHGQEIADKCADEPPVWPTFADGNTYRVTKLWSNASMSCQE